MQQTTDQPDCFNCRAPFNNHNWRNQRMGFCPLPDLWPVRGVWSDLYWPQDTGGGRADHWESHPVLSPLEQLLVNNIETIREVLDDWLGESPTWDVDVVTVELRDLLKRAHTLRREIAELSGLDDVARDT
jgi:hypothetical protein